MYTGGVSMNDESLQRNIDMILNKYGMKSTLVCRKFSIGKNVPIRAAVIYINALASKDFIDRDVLNPLMLYVDEELESYEGVGIYLTEKYIPMSNTVVVNDLSKAIEELKRGKTIVAIENTSELIIVDTTGGKYRDITEPINESVIKGSREGFMENLETNVSIIRRRIKDETLTVEYLKLGRRTQTDVALIYISSVVSDELVNKVRSKISIVDVDGLHSTGELEQYIDKKKYGIFPQFLGSERPDKIVPNILSGRIAVAMEGTPYIMVFPSLFTDFFQTVDDYYEKPILSSFLRFLRLFSAFIVITLDPIFMEMIRLNNEFVPIKFVIPIVQARQGIGLSIFLEILLMEIVVELLREGGLRLPSKIAQTLSVVGGIIIGDTAVKSRVVSSTTLFVVGITTIASFLISNYDMSLAVRFLRFPMLILSYALGVFGIAIGWYLILEYLCSIENFGVPYFSFKKNDIKDELVRAPLRDMKQRPEAYPNKDSKKQGDFEEKVNNSNDEQ